jgi:23S rRNA (adenine2503-C2)-methyltransferase
MNLLGMTFDEVRSAVKPRTHEVKALRAAYRRLLRGETPVRESSLAPTEPGIASRLSESEKESGGKVERERIPVPAGGRWTDLLHADVLPIVRRLDDGELVKFIQQTPDGLEIESVVVPMQRRGRSWKTLCVSSQVGCARACEFCETGRLGLLRNLSAAEIVGQFVAARRELLGVVPASSQCVAPANSRCAYNDSIRNVVFMGMGEPLDNFDAVVQAVRVLTDRAGLSLGQERIKISTVGRISGIRRLGELGWRRVTLAVSLNAPNDEIRSRLMPINRLEPMAALRDALLAYPRRSHFYFMIEYVLIPGVNDAPAHARELADYLRPLPTVVNVIPYNPRPDSPWPAPTEAAISGFLDALSAAGQICKRRLTKGRDQMAACGQLGNRDLRRRRP